jgi:tyrosinase
MSEATQTTRWQRVREILEDAAGDSPADYGGVGRPWNLPLDRLLTVEVHGVRMIAPAPAAASGARPCCGGGAKASRAADSGLVRGMRGQAPFDGSRFPRIPFGGRAVAGDDIDFIARWIDDGAPAEGTDLATFPMVVERAASGLEEVAGCDTGPAHVYEVWDGSPTTHAARQNEVKQRVNLDCMTPGQVEELREAFRALYALNKWPEDRRSYNNIALIHQNHCQHGWERFLPWHRIYLYEFEQALQDQVPGVSMPYWDFTMPQYRPECPELGWIIPRAMQAFLTDASLVILRTVDPVLPKDAVDAIAAAMVEPVPRPTYTSQQRFFAAVRVTLKKAGYSDADIQTFTTGAHRNRFIDALLAANALWYPLRYPAEYTKDDKRVNLQTAFHYHYPSARDIREILSLRTFRDFGGGSLYNDSFGFLDQNPHNTMHLWTGGMNPDYVSTPDTLEGDPGTARNRGVRVAGRRFHSREDMYTQPMFGDMFSNLTASYDPVFWCIHVNVDRLWHEWQEMHPGAVPADLDAVLTPWSYTIADTLDIARFGYEYVKSTHLVPVGLEQPVGRFVSRPITVPQPVRDGFRQAEVRLHRVPQLDRSCFIRVFLNVPDANASTPLDHPGYAGYLAVFGHGPCIGGPGHCGVPEPRAFDRRPRSHNTPRNHRVVVTETARRLLEGGDGTLTVTLVVIGADYCEDPELLRLEGVSLNFLD